MFPKAAQLPLGAYELKLEDISAECDFQGSRILMGELELLHRLIEIVFQFAIAICAPQF